jgi:hypothetical protein
MNYQETKQFEMLSRIRDWGLKHKHIFRPESMGRQTLEFIVSEVAELRRLSAEQTKGLSDARRFARSRAKAREALWDFVKRIHRTSIYISENSPRFTRFRLPRAERDLALLGTARAYLLTATPLAAEFIAYEMPEDFIAALQRAIGDLEGAIREQSEAKRSHMSATRGIHARLAKAVVAVKRMHIIIRNRVPDETIIRAFERASRVENLRRRAQGGSTS